MQSLYWQDCTFFGPAAKRSTNEPAIALHNLANFVWAVGHRNKRTVAGTPTVRQVATACGKRGRRKLEREGAPLLPLQAPAALSRYPKPKSSAFDKCILSKRCASAPVTC